MTKEKAFTRFAPPGAPKPKLPLSHGIKVKPGASYIFVSALAPLDDQGKSLVGFDVHSQTKQVMDRMKKVLEASGATLDDVVHMRVYLTDANDWQGCCDAYRPYFKEFPTVLLEAVSGFMFGPGQLVQIEAIAAI